MPLAICTSRSLAPVMSGGVSRVGMLGRYYQHGRAGLQTGEAVTNLVINPSFEVGLTGWTESISATGTSARSDEQAHVGFGSLKLVMTDAGAAGQQVARILTTAIAVSAETPYTVQAEAYIPQLGGSCVWQVGVNWYTAGDVLISTDIIAVSASNDGFARAGDTFTSPATTAKAAVWTRLYAGAADDTGIAYVDCVQFDVEVYLTPYCDGDQPGCSWSGTAHETTSSRTAPALYYATEAIGDSGRFTTLFRTPPEMVNARGYWFTIASLWDGSTGASRLDIYLNYSTGNEGQVDFAFYDAAANLLGGESTAQLSADTDYWLFASWDRTSGTQTELTIDVAAAGATAVTNIYSATVTGVRQAADMRMYIGTHGVDTARSLNGTVWWGEIGTAAFSADEKAAIIEQAAEPPYTGTRYYCGCWEGYDAEELSEAVYMGGAPLRYRIAADGYEPAPLETSDDPKRLADITESVPLHLICDSKADLDERMAAIERILGDARDGRAAWWYVQPANGRQLRAKLRGGSLARGESWDSLLRDQYLVRAAELLVTHEPLYRGQELQLCEGRAVTNYSATALTSPVPIYNPGDEGTPLRLVWENPLPASQGWDLVRYSIGRKYGTPGLPLYDLNGTAHAGALSDAHNAGAVLSSAYGSINTAGTSVVVDHTPRRYLVFAKVAADSVGTPFDFAMSSYNGSDARARIGHETTGITLTGANALQTVDLGEAIIPSEGGRFGDDTQTFTLYVLAKVASGTPTMVVDYIRLMPVDVYGELVVDTANFGAGNPYLLWDGETGLVTGMDSGFDDPYPLSISNVRGDAPKLAPGWNNLCVWAHDPGEENEHAVTLKISRSSFIPRYRSVKGAV